MATADIDCIATLDQEMRNDQRFDGQFFSAVMTTGIFCRPGCPGRPRSENVRFFSTAAAAAEAGFRPCLRCHPESAPDAPEWQSTSPVVTRALRLIGEGMLDEGSVSDLAQRLRVSTRQLQRIFVEELGAPPVAVAQTRRLLFAKKLIDETDLTMAEIAFSAGYSSVRRFNEALKQTYARTPTELRRKRRRSSSDVSAATIELKLFYREPYNWPAMLAFLAAHGTPFVERVDRTVYRRTIQVDGTSGVISVRPLPNQRAALLRVPASLSRFLLPITERVKQIFDLKADPITIARELGHESELGPTVAVGTGMRLPGCWDGFEVAVCALLDATAPGDGTKLTSQLVAHFGDYLVDSGDPSLTRLFPTPQRLAGASLEQAGLSSAQARSIRLLSAAIQEGNINLSPAESFDRLARQLESIPDADSRVTAYVALRLLGEPDLDLCGNPILFGSQTDRTAPLADDAAVGPWRSYATMYRWAASRS